MPHDLPPWHTVYQQMQRWYKASVFDTIIHDLRAVLRLVQERHAELSTAIFGSRTLQSPPGSGTRAVYDGAKRRRGSKVPYGGGHRGHLLALHMTAANEQAQSQGSMFAAKVQEVTGDAIKVAFVA